MILLEILPSVTVFRGTHVIVLYESGDASVSGHFARSVNLALQCTGRLVLVVPSVANPDH